jgi:hypothetical protein
MFNNIAGMALLTIHKQFEKDEIEDILKDHWMPVGYKIEGKDYVILMAKFFSEDKEN